MLNIEVNLKRVDRVLENQCVCQWKRKKVSFVQPQTQLTFMDTGINHTELMFAQRLSSVPHMLTHSFVFSM